MEKDFKKRWNNHKTSFRLSTHEHETSLSTYIWSLKDQGKEYSIRWEIAKKSTPYRCGGRLCTLCTEEKLFILQGDKNMINSKSELISKCRHKGKFLLSKFDHGWDDVTMLIDLVSRKSSHSRILSFLCILFENRFRETQCNKIYYVWIPVMIYSSTIRSGSQR